MTLDPHQLAAVQSDAPRIQLRAGAGSGKTRVLVERVARLLEGGYHPGEVLCLTFTRAAAGEMRERLAARLPDFRGLHRLTITTFHAWASRIIREFHDVAGYAREFTIRDAQDRTDLVLHIGRELNLKWKSERRLWQEEIVRRRYRDLLREVQAIDFDGLEHELGRLLERAEVVEQLRGRWAHVLVDETQDNSTGQWSILETLSPRNLFVVGDHAQSIYGFRGADVEAFTDLGDEWVVLDLPTNYRSAPEIVADANRVAAGMSPPGIEMVAARTEAGVVEEVAPDGALARLLWEAATAPEDCAVLAPTWRLLDEVAELLTGANIPWRLARPVPDVWESPEMRWLLQCIRAAVNPHDHLALREALNSFALRITVGEWAAVRAASLQDGRPVVEVLHERMPAGCAWIVEAIASGSWETILGALADELARLHLDTRAAYMRDDVSRALDTFEHAPEAETPTAEFQALLDWYGARHLDAEPVEADAAPAVTLGTIHSAKGLEWPAVWLLDADQAELWPGTDDAERARLQYVARTRARDRLRLVVGGGAL